MCVRARTQKLNTHIHKYDEIRKKREIERESKKDKTKQNVYNFEVAKQVFLGQSKAAKKYATTKPAAAAKKQCLRAE